MKRKIKFNLTDAAVLIAFSVLTMIGAFEHEMWFDEAEAWVIARDNSFRSLGTVLRSEGHPFLWYIVLKIFSAANFPADIVPFISWFFTALTAAFILLRSPFKRVLNYLIIFSSGFLYFNSVISRVYCLIPLILVMIADVYPARKEHPVYYGFLVALLTNTHICICGIVAVLGINMLVELIKDWKMNSLKERICTLTGLGVAASGVMILLFTLAGSMSTNAEITSSDSSGMADRLSGVFLALYDVPVQMTLFSDAGFLPVLVCMLYMFCFLLIMFLSRHNRVAFYVLLLFNLCYVIICGVIWYTIPNRAAIVYFVFVFVLWIAAEDACLPVFKSPKIHIIADTRIIRAVINKILILDSEPVKNIEKILCVLFALTVPAGLINLLNDCRSDFAFEKSAAEYIKENYSSDTTVIVTTSDSWPQLTCYMPEFRFYAAYIGKEYTYHNHEISYDDIANKSMYDEAAAQEYLEQWDNVIFVDANRFDEYAASRWIDSAPGKVVYSGIGSADYATKSTNIMVCETTMTDFIEYAGR